MRPDRIAAFATLLLANAVVWRCRLAVPEAGFDGDRFALAVGETYDPVELERVRFEDEGLLPADYVYLEGTDDTPWHSVYAGYFPGGGLLREQPHDPAVCYVALGWDVVGEPAPLELAGRTATRIVVARDGERRAAIYWQQRPPGTETWTGQLLRGRTDSVWVRVEVDAAAGLTRTLQARLARVADAAVAALP